MKEYPILFSTDMVKAILDGRKTQTRRTLKNQPIDIIPMNVPNEWVTLKERNPNHGQVVKCRYGDVGDRLWVRETHYRWGQWVKNGFAKTGRQAWTFKAVSNTMGGVRMPDNRPPFGEFDRTQTGWHKRPSIHMPRWASRITLEITEIRAERLQEITFEDCLTEGIVHTKEWQEVDYKAPELINPTDLSNEEADKEIDRGWIAYAQQAFAKLWDSLNAKRGHSWESNPWVWVIGFKENDGFT